MTTTGTGRSSRALPDGMRLNERYTINHALGLGGFGITYLAYDFVRQTPCAIKEYFPVEWAVRETKNMAIRCTRGNEDFFEHGMQVFIEEANLLVDLKHVTSIVDVWDIFCEYGTIFMVMEYVDGVSVSNFMKQTGRPMSLNQAGEMLLQIARALASIHRSMLLHRDISPDNILYKPSEDVFVLIDFGSTRAFAFGSPNSMSVLVKPGFAPIEQYSKGGRQGPWTDVYALAATYYYAVTGKKVPPAPDRELGEPLIPLNRFVPTLAPQISNAVERALCTQIEGRPQTVEEFLYDMTGMYM